MSGGELVPLAKPPARRGKHQPQVFVLDPETNERRRFPGFDGDAGAAELEETARQFLQAAAAQKTARLATEALTEKLLRLMAGEFVLFVGSYRIARQDGKTKVLVAEVGE